MHFIYVYFLSVTDAAARLALLIVVMLFRQAEGSVISFHIWSRWNEFEFEWIYKMPKIKNLVRGEIDRLVLHWSTESDFRLWMSHVQHGSHDVVLRWKVLPSGECTCSSVHQLPASNDVHSSRSIVHSYATCLSCVQPLTVAVHIVWGRRFNV